MSKNIRTLFYSYLLIFALTPIYLSAQRVNTEFGKNRVQYHDDFDEWLMYETPNFITYWYGKGRNVGQAVVQTAELDFKEVRDLLEHRMNDKIELIVYTDLTDLKQSNIGIEEAFENREGRTKIAGNKVFVHFNGDHNHLRKQVREGIAGVFINSMLFGANIQEIVQNAVLLNLPNWFRDGLSSFVGESWNTTLDNELKALLLHPKNYDFDKLIQIDPKLVGHSFWNYIDRTFGRSTISNVLYLTRINRSVENGFLYVLGSSFEELTESWKAYYKDRYTKHIGETSSFAHLVSIPVKNKKDLPVTGIRLSPNGDKMLYVLNEIGKYKVYLHDFQTDQTSVLFKTGFRNPIQATDYNYPLLAWSPSGTEVTIIHEQRDLIKLRRVDLLTNDVIEEDMATQYTRVLDADYINSAELLITGMVNGFSDLFRYQLATRQTFRITDDFYDDLEASFVRLGGKAGVLFLSNRPDTILFKQKLDSILPLSTFDVFYYALEENDRNDLVRITNTPLANERAPMAVDTNYFVYLSDQYGAYNQNSGYLKTVFAYYQGTVRYKNGTEEILAHDSLLNKIDPNTIDTLIRIPIYKQIAVTQNQSNYPFSITNMDVADRSDKMVLQFTILGKTELYTSRVEPEKTISAASTRFQNERITTLSKIREKNELISNKTADEKRILYEPEASDFLFQSPYDNSADDHTLLFTNDTLARMAENLASLDFLKRNESVQSDTEKKRSKFRSGRIIPYRLKFRTDYFTTKVDNELLFGGLDTYAGNKMELDNRPPGLLFKFNLKDLFEDYEFEGGIRFPTSFNGAEYFLVFNNKKQRLDKSFALYRSSFREEVSNSETLRSLNITELPFARNRNVSVIGLYQLKYPLDIFRSIRATSTIRLNRFVWLSTEQATLDIPTLSEQRVGLKLEYVFDNTLLVSTNIRNGSRYKFFGEIVKRLDIDLVDNVRFDFGKGIMTILGFDARHYQRIFKYSVIAGRAVGATSFGSEKILYYLGGVENWLFPKFDRSVPFPANDEFAFQTQASQMRGFKQNIRNGNSLVLINTELRVPFLRYIFPNTRSNFVKNLQVVGFFDVGAAWEGLDPYSRNNPLNTSVVSNPTVTAVVNYFRDPIVAGFGVGARTTIFGYFVKVDYAWGYESREVRKPIFYLSLGQDF